MEKITFGRATDCDIVFDEDKVSRHHGYLLVSDGKVYVFDTDSTNGIFVNGQRIHERAMLSPGDKVILAKKIPFKWENYVSLENTTYGDETVRGFDDSNYDDDYGYNRPSGKALIDIPSRMEINQNHAEVYRNGASGADWKVPLKRNVGDAVGKTLGCVISVIIVVVLLVIFGLILSSVK